MKPGGEVANAVPGDSGTQTHPVEKVIVTASDRDFVDVTVREDKGTSKVTKALVGAALAVATLTTTYHHPFYDVTQAAFVDAVDLKVGEQVQTTDGGTATVTAVRPFHQDTVTYDLTIGGLHTYYVFAGQTPVLVHNCGNSPDDRASMDFTDNGRRTSTMPTRRRMAET